MADATTNTATILRPVSRNPELPKLLTIIKREFLERVRTKWFVISTLFFPLLMACMMILPAWLSSRTKASDSVSRIVILDATGTSLGERVARSLVSDSARAAGAKAPVVRVVTPADVAAAEESATQDVMAKRLPGYLVVDSATLRGDSARYAGRNASSIPDVERVRDAVRTSVIALRLENAGLPADRVNELTRARVRLPATRITDKGRSGAGGIGGLAVGFVLAFILYMMMALYGQQVLRGVMEEKTTRVAEVVVSSVRPTTLMAGKVLGVGAVAIVQQLLWVAASIATAAALAPVLSRLASRGSTGGTAAAAGAASRGGMPVMGDVFGAITPWTILAVMLFFVLGFLFYASLFAAVGATVNSEQDAQQAATPIGLLLIPSILMVQPIAFNPTGTLAQVMSMLPFSAPIIMPLRMVMIEVPAWEMAASIASALGGCLLALWVAAKVYRTGLLMYGKRPTYREMAKWMRYS